MVKPTSYLPSRFKDGGWTYAEVIAASEAQFCGRVVEHKPLPKAVRRELQEVLDSGEADDPTRGAVEVSPPKRAKKKTAKKSAQKALF